MTKFSKKIAAGAMAFAVTASACVPAFAAATDYKDSIASVEDDIKILTEEGYNVVGNDETQEQKSAYTSIGKEDTDANGQNFVESTYSHPCEVYATMREGSNLIDPETGDEIDGSILVSVPTKVILSGTPDEAGLNVGEYMVKVKGNIAGTTVITVEPTSNSDTIYGGGKALDENLVQFYMGQNGKKDIVATVNQDKTKFADAGCTIDDDNLSKTVMAADSFEDITGVKGTISTEATAGSWEGLFNFNISMDTVADNTVTE